MPAGGDDLMAVADAVAEAPPVSADMDPRTWSVRWALGPNYQELDDLLNDVWAGSQ